MFRKLLLLCMFPFACFAQTYVFTNPDCIIAFSFTAPGTSPLSPHAGYDNRQQGCNVWSMTYSIYGFSSTLNISLQSAPNTSTGPGSWVTFSGQTLLNSTSNPNTSATTAMITQLMGYQPWVQVSLNSVGAGIGLVVGSAFGWKIPSASGTGGGGGGGSTNATIVNPLGSTTSSASVSVVIANDQGTVPVQTVGDGAVLSNQQGVTGSAVALASHNAKTACVKALIGNTINVYVGPSGVTDSTGMELAPGQAVCLPVTNTNLLYVIASTTGASVSWIATN